jgi:hypothetical protein
MAMNATTANPGSHTLLPGQDPEGKPVLAVLLKRTYRIPPSGTCIRAAEDRPLVGGDEPYEDPMNSTIRYEADFVPWKLATDIVLNGSAYAPGGRPVRELLATLQIDRVQKAVRVIGDRTCQYRLIGNPTFSEPAPFAQMELRYERAYGGVDVYTNSLCPYIYPRNHLGRGFAVGSSKAVVDGLALPNLEDPSDLLTPAKLCIGKMENWTRQPVPAGFGWYSKCWHPRAGWAGILPGDKPVEQMLRSAYATLLPPAERAIYEAHSLPVVDFRFFNGASPGLSLPFLKGDEVVQLTNLTPNGPNAFQLPGDRPAITLDIGQGIKEAPVVLQTVQLRMDDNELDLVWRAAFPYGGLDTLPDVEKYDVSIRG